MRIDSKPMIVCIAFFVGAIMGAGASSVLMVVANDDKQETGIEQRDCYHRSTTAVLWNLTAAEARALCYQAYNAARAALDSRLANSTSEKRTAIIIDLDETVLDTSKYQAERVWTGISFPAGWKDWVDSHQALAVPGAKEFLDYAESRGVEIFYLSNRPTEMEEGTVQNLVEQKMPFADEKHVLLRTGEKKKGFHAREIEKGYDVLLRIGDGLDDFFDEVGKLSVSDRTKVVEQHREEFAKKFIVLPNAMYGYWEGALYDYEWDLPAIEKRFRRMQWLKEGASFRRPK